VNEIGKPIKIANNMQPIIIAPINSGLKKSIMAIYLSQMRN